MNNFHPVIHPLPYRNGKSWINFQLIQHCLDTHKSCIVHTSKPKEKLAELKERYPNADFKVLDWGVRIKISQ